MISAKPLKCGHVHDPSYKPVATESQNSVAQHLTTAQLIQGSNAIGAGSPQPLAVFFNGGLCQPRIKTSRSTSSKGPGKKYNCSSPTYCGHDKKMMKGIGYIRACIRNRLDLVLAKSPVHKRCFLIGGHAHS